MIILFVWDRLKLYMKMHIEKSSSSDKSSYFLSEHRYFKKGEEYIEYKMHNIQLIARRKRRKKGRCFQ